MKKWVVVDCNGCELDTMVIENLVKMVNVLARKGEAFSVRVEDVDEE